MTTTCTNRSTHLNNDAHSRENCDATVHRKCKKNSLRLLLFLLVLSASAITFNSCHLLGGGGGDDDDNNIKGDSIIADIDEDIDIDALFDSFALTEEDIEYLKKNPIIVTPENSPDNPALIDVTFTDDDYAQAWGYAALVTPDMPEADFPEFGIHVNLKPWNLAFEKDSLIVLRMPNKYDEVSNSTLYTYDYFLLSGQNKFLTDVEITAPVQGDPNLFKDFVTYNSETGLWESVYYELSEDRKTFTAYMTHFSPGTQRSDSTENALDIIQTEGQNAIDLYKQGGQSIFIQLKKEMKPKYEDCSHHLYPVTVARTTNYEKFFNAKTKNQTQLLNKIISEGGYIQKKDAFLTALGWLGIDDLTESTSKRIQTGNDIGGTITGDVDLAQKAGLAFKTVSSDNITRVSGFFTFVGTSFLALNVADEIAQGKSLDNIAEDNALSITSTTIGIVGLGAAAFTTPAAAAVSVMATLASAYIFAYSSVDYLNQQAFNKEHPLGAPTSITEAAYHYYLKDNAHSEKGYLHDLNSGWLSWLYPSQNATEVIDSLAVLEHTPERLLDCDEKNWLAAYQLLIKKYATDPKKLYKAYDKMFDDYAGAFWKESPEVQREYFRKACQRNIKIEMYKDFVDGAGVRTMRVSNTRDAQYIYPAPIEYPLGSDAKSEWADLQNMLILYASEMQKQGTSATINDVWEAVFRDWDKDPNAEMYYINHAQKSHLKERAIKLLKLKSAPLVQDYYEKLYRQSIKEIKDMLDNTIVPLLNTRLTFYAQDLNHPSDPPYNALVDGGATRIAFDFDCDKKPLFAPRNANEVDTTYHLYLIPTQKETVLLETTVYHYLRYGSPLKVNIYVEGNDKPIPAKANWKNVKLETDPNLKRIVQSMHYEQENPNQRDYVSYYGGGGNWKQKTDISLLQQNIIDTKIPIEFRVDATQKKKERKKKVVYEGPIIPHGDLEGSGISEEEYNRQYRESGLPWGVVYEYEDE